MVVQERTMLLAKSSTSANLCVVFKLFSVWQHFLGQALVGV